MGTSISLRKQAYAKLQEMQHFGESKRKAKAQGTDKDKIFSASTYQTYKQHIYYFCDWMQEMHPEITKLKRAKRYINEWLQLRTDQGLSPWTVQTEAAALNKLYGIEKDDPKRFQPPKRERAVIKRSRNDETVGDKHFSEERNNELVEFCKATGCRRTALERLQGRDYYTRAQLLSERERLAQTENMSDLDKTFYRCIKDALETFPDQQHFLYHRKDKGGKYRLAPIMGTAEQIEAVVNRMRSTEPYQRVWQRVHSNCDVHGYRGDYATRLYGCYAREIEEIPYDKQNSGTGRMYQSDIYTCRGDQRGKKLDKRAMLVASKGLGHNRIDVIASNYLYKM